MSSYKFLKPYTFSNGIQIKNRIVIPPMTEGSSFADGTVTQDELNYFSLRAGGTGMFISPVANVSNGGKGFEGELSVSSDRFIPRLNQMALTMKQRGTKAILQIFHAGRMSNSKILRGHKPVSASAVKNDSPGAETPQSLSNSEIKKIISDFGLATRRAIQAGFDGIELHGANGYLMHQFFSPHANRRTDFWGGNVEKRMHFSLEIIKTAYQTIKKYAHRPFLLGYRISPEEETTPGIRIKDTLKFIDVLANQPLDYLHISQRYVWRASGSNPNDKEPLIKKIKKQVKNRLPLIVVGSIVTPHQAEEVIKQGFSFVALGKEHLIEPHWVQKVKMGKENEINYQISEADLANLQINPRMWQYFIGNPKNDPRNTLSIMRGFWED